jgi:hypothetical protein
LEALLDLELLDLELLGVARQQRQGKIRAERRNRKERDVWSEIGDGELRTYEVDFLSLRS